MALYDPRVGKIPELFVLPVVPKIFPVCMMTFGTREEPGFQLFNFCIKEGKNYVPFKNNEIHGKTLKRKTWRGKNGHAPIRIFRRSFLLSSGFCSERVCASLAARGLKPIKKSNHVFGKICPTGDKWRTYTCNDRSLWISSTPIILP